MKCLLLLNILVVACLCVASVRAAAVETSTVVPTLNSTALPELNSTLIGNVASEKPLKAGVRQGRCRIVWEWVKALFSPTDNTLSKLDSSDKKDSLFPSNPKKFLLSPETSKDKDSRDSESDKDKDKDKDKDSERDARKILRARANKPANSLTYDLPW